MNISTTSHPALHWEQDARRLQAAPKLKQTIAAQLDKECWGKRPHEALAHDLDVGGTHWLLQAAANSGLLLTISPLAPSSSTQL